MVIFIWINPECHLILMSKYEKTENSDIYMKMLYFSTNWTDLIISQVLIFNFNTNLILKPKLLIYLWSKINFLTIKFHLLGFLITVYNFFSSSL